MLGKNIMRKTEVLVKTIVFGRTNEWSLSLYRSRTLDRSTCVVCGGRILCRVFGWAVTLLFFRARFFASSVDDDATVDTAVGCSVVVVQHHAVKVAKL